MDIQIGYVSENRTLEKVRDELLKHRRQGWDTETTGLDALTSKIRLLQIAVPGKTYVLDLFKLSKGAVKEFILDPLIPNKDIVKIFHNAKFDLKMIETNFDYGLHEVESLYDTYLVAKLLDGGRYMNCGLGNVALHYLNVHLPKENQKFNWAGDIYKEQITYAGIDAAILLPLWERMNIGVDRNHLHIAAALEFEACLAIAQMELNGIKVDTEMWLGVAERTKEELYQLDQRMVEVFGDLNFGSSQQMCKVLSEMTGYNVTSTKKEALQQLIELYVEKPDMFGNVRNWLPAVQLYMQRKKLAKDLEAFGFEFLKHVHPKTGRIHPSFVQNDTNTQRMSCTKPNMQQIPRDSDKRAAFVPEPGNKYWNPDYSQIELRGIAQFSKEPNFVRAYENDEDIHTYTAMAVYNLDSLDQVTPDQRQNAKPVSFGVPYGMGGPSYALKRGIPLEQARAELKRFYKNNPVLEDWFEQQRQYVRQYDCVRSASGRIRALSNWKWDEHAANQASRNFPIQSSSADITKRAIGRMFRELPRNIKLVNVVHDETLNEIPDDMVEEYGPEIDRIMREAGEEFFPDIKIVVEGKASERWEKG